MIEPSLSTALSPREDMPNIHLIDRPAGSGKTRARIKDVIRAVKAGYKVIWTTPTVGVLQRETFKRLTGESSFDELDEYLSDLDVYLINATVREEEGYTDIGSMIYQVVLDDIEMMPGEGRVFLCSWVGFQASGSLRRAAKFRAFPKTRLIVDEVPEVLAFTFYQSADVNFRDYLSFSKGIVTPLPEQQAHWEAAVKGVSNNSVFDDSDRLKELAALLINPEYVTTLAKHSIRAKIHLTSYLLPSVFSSFKEVEVLGANSRHSLMYLLYTKWGVRFRINEKYEDDRRPIDHLGDLFTIVPIQDVAITKNAMSKKAKARWVVGRLFDIVKAFYGAEKPFIYCVNNAVNVGPMPEQAYKTASMLHGSNEYTNFEAAAFLCSLNPGLEFLQDLEERWGIDYGVYLRARTAEVIYQYSYRIKARLGDRSLATRYLIVVLDRMSAAALREKIPGSVVDESYIEEDPEQKFAGNAGNGIAGFLRLTPPESQRLREYKALVDKCHKEGRMISVQDALSTTGPTRYNNLIAMAENNDVSITDLEAILLGFDGRSIFPKPVLSKLDFGFSNI